MQRIIPMPHICEEREGAFALAGAEIFVKEGTDSRIIAEVSELFGGNFKKCDGMPAGKAVFVHHGELGEGYELTVTCDSIVICGEGAEGAFYAVQTLRQLMGDSVPCCYIKDRPDLKYRGLYLDVSRGRVPTLAKLKSIADTLARYKMNSLQLYIEDAFTFRELEGIADEANALTPDEIKELDAYCRQRFIDLVPSMASFGHLFTLLQSDRYNHISELKGHRMTRNYWLERQWHHTVDVYHPETMEVITSMAEQLLPLFSSEYFNICCDETMDLCGGANKGRDKGEAYFYHVDRLVELMRSRGKRVMLWGDECMARPDMAKERLPEDAVVLNWCYRKSVAEWIPKMFWERGFSQICCTGTSCWDNFIENINISTGNIESFAAHAKKYGTLGILNTSWGDFGHVCSFDCNLYGVLLGAEKAWNAESVTATEYEMAASRLLYGVESFNMADTLRALGRAAFTCSWSEFVIWHSATHLEGKTAPLVMGGEREVAAEDIWANIDLCIRERKRLEEIGTSDGVICDLILAARAIELMNRLVLTVNGAEGCDGREELREQFDLWLSDYSRAWLRDNKPSQLWRVEEFVRNITE